ncbi:hypothetical protein NPIL_197601 [Nephila pilipes]|uniref:Uncharacterized protein n=1 Tax=Nephila pilipes TaxID=299642 RepID=A0A8X6UJ62_NEPPI|nr:hypothetical protein NPIL_197601 [Nephila pilipes]
MTKRNKYPIHQQTRQGSRRVLTPGKVKPQNDQRISKGLSCQNGGERCWEKQELGSHFFQCCDSDLNRLHSCSKRCTLYQPALVSGEAKLSGRPASFACYKVLLVYAVRAAASFVSRLQKETVKAAAVLLAEVRQAAYAFFLAILRQCFASLR